ncbi:heme exporter protein CcmD [Rickettsiales bacterium]|nr:heme exporter protein CcmD [Rickettsiales bacterium]
MKYFLELLESEKHLPYVVSSYLIAFFIIALLVISSKIQNKKIKKKYLEMVNDHEK